MLIAHIHIPPGYLLDYKETVRQAVRTAAATALDIADPNLVYVSVSEAHGRIGDGLPTVMLDLPPIADPQRKAALAAQVAQAVAAHAGGSTDDVYLLIRETASENHYFGRSGV